MYYVLLVVIIVGHYTYYHNCCYVALQNLYAFWGELMVNKLNTKGADGGNDDNKDNDINTGESSKMHKCSVRLVWPHKYKVHKVFREPHLFVPNLNVM